MAELRGADRKRLLSDIDVEVEFGYPKARTLRKWRLFGDRGPRWRKLRGAIRYERSDVEAWIAQSPSRGQAPAAFG